MLGAEDRRRHAPLWPGSVLSLCSGSQELWAQGKWDEWALGHRPCPEPGVGGKPS